MKWTLLLLFTLLLFSFYRGNWDLGGLKSTELVGSGAKSESQDGLAPKPNL